MADASGIAQQLQRDGYAVIPGLLSQQAQAAARAELDELLDVAEWGSGFDGTRTKRAWAPLAVTRCLDQAAPAPLVLDAVEQMIGPGTQVGITCAIQVHPGQKAQVLHYDQGTDRSCCSAAACTTVPAPTSPGARGSGSSSTTSSPGSAPARRTPSAPATRTSASSRSASRNSSALTSPPLTSASSTAGTPATGS